jgi:hypothetical protein
MTTFYSLTTLGAFRLSNFQSSKLLLTLVSIIVFGFGAHDNICVLSRLLRVLKWCFLFDEKGCLDYYWSPSPPHPLLVATHSITNFTVGPD